MSTFRIGQRVRIVKCTKYNEFLGKSATITSMAIFTDWRLDIDGFGERANTGQFFAVSSWQIEPIVDDGRQVTTWDACAWQPIRETTKENEPCAL